jgi:membrane protein implicated in regulation of membrane protease activity
MLTVPVFWIIGGIILIIAELFFPVLVLVFFGASAILTGLLALGGHLDSFGSQLGLFAALSLILILGLRRVAKRVFKGLTADVADNEPGFEDFVGRQATAVFVSSEANQVRVSFRGSEWEASSASPLAVGDSVRIVGRNGARLIVERIPQ